MKLKQILVFVVISSVTLTAIEHPWKKRNQHYFGEYSMSASTYYGQAELYNMWIDYKQFTTLARNTGLGIGNYLAPEQSAEVIAKLDRDKKAGSAYALQCLIKAVYKKPWDAIQFKLRAYNILWLGSECNAHIYSWCLISTFCFFIFLFLTRFQFLPGLWLFPLFLLCISPLIHYEHRYSQPFFLFVTPIATMYALKHFLMKHHTSQQVDIKQKQFMKT